MMWPLTFFDGLKVLEVMGEADSVELSGDTLRWLAAKFKADANDIMTHLDHAEHAREGTAARRGDVRGMMAGQVPYQKTGGPKANG
jgi:hypothetical protein